MRAGLERGSGKIKKDNLMTKTKFSITVRGEITTGWNNGARLEIQKHLRNVLGLKVTVDDAGDVILNYNRKSEKLLGSCRIGVTMWSFRFTGIPE